MMRRRLGNNGFTLVELLIGVIILAIIVIPLLRAFFTSQGASARAKEIRNQTLAGQNVIESCKATDIAALIDAVKGGVTPLSNVAAGATVYALNGTTGAYDQVTQSSTEAADGAGYKIMLTGVTAGAKTYDAILYLDATKYPQTNNTPIVDYKPMDAVYIQPDPVKDTNNNPDIKAAQTFASNAQIDSGSVVSYTSFLNRMARIVTITISKLDSGGGNGIISCKAAFHYDTTYTYTVTDNTKTPPLVTTVTVPYSTEFRYDFYSGNYTATTNGIYGLYFFFYPNSISSTDRIEVLNYDDVVMSVYLVAQGNIAGYNPVVLLRETYNMSTPAAKYALMYSNLTTSYSSWKGGWNDFAAFNGTLIGTPAKNRLYDIKVELYKAGTGFAAPVLTTLDASSLK